MRDLLLSDRSLYLHALAFLCKRPPNTYIDLFLISAYFTQDKLEMGAHHIVGISLLCVSWITHCYRPLALGLFSHDPADVLLEVLDTDIFSSIAIKRKLT